MSATKASTLLSSVTSRKPTWALPPALTISAAAASATSRLLRAPSATAAPSRPSARAAALPSPPLAPVTIATRPSRRLPSFQRGGMALVRRLHGVPDLDVLVEARLELPEVQALDVLGVVQVQAGDLLLGQALLHGRSVGRRITHRLEKYGFRNNN